MDPVPDVEKSIVGEPAESAYTGSNRTATDSEKQGLHDANANGNGIGVNVKRAEAEFAELSKQLSRASEASRQISRSQSRRPVRDDKDAPDLERAKSADEDDGEPFDLEKTLRGNKGEEEEAGIRSKRIGIVLFFCVCR